MHLETHASRGAADAGPLRRTRLAAILMGVALGLAAQLRDDPPPVPGGARPAVWVADRDGQRLVGLDADLIEVADVDLRWPLEVEGRADGAFWCARAAEGLEDGAFELSLHGPDGTVRRTDRFGPVLDLDVLGGADALLVEARVGEDPAAWRTRADGARWIVLQTHALRCATGTADRVLAGTDAGELLLYDADGTRTLLAVRHVALQVIDVAPGPGLVGEDVEGHEPPAARTAGTASAPTTRRPRGTVGPPGTDGAAAGGAVAGTVPAGQPETLGVSWWVLGLDAQGLGRLLALGPALEVRWEVATGLRPRHLIPVPGRVRAWVADITAPRVRRFGPGGVLEVDRDDLQVLGLDRGVAWPDAGVVLTAPGALLRLDAAGNLRPSQGGFHYPVDLTAPRPGAR